MTPEQKEIWSIFHRHGGIDDLVMGLLFTFQSLMAGEQCAIRDAYREFKEIDDLLDNIRDLVKP